MELIQVDPQAAPHEDDLREIVERFEDELEQDEPDSTILRKFLEQAADRSTSIAAKMGLMALQRDVVEVLDIV